MIAPAALDESGKPADFSTMEEQMRVTYANTAKLLARFKATLDHVVEETLYVLDVDADFDGLLGKGQPRYADQIAGAPRPRHSVGFFAHLARDRKRWSWLSWPET
jgi:enamine deaminase RidA (YjgF/YER057c/UK114 family)